jgi:hypothetical protein
MPICRDASARVDGIRMSYREWPGECGPLIGLPSLAGHKGTFDTSDYLIPDPDWEPIRWSTNDPRRATSWGHKPPASWSDEASWVENMQTGELLPTSKPPLKDRPDFIT